MDVNQIIGLVAPVILPLLIQGLKKVMKLNGYAALAIVFAIGGASALVGVGPTPGTDFVDTTINAGWIIGVSTFVYSLFKNRKTKP